MLELLIRRGSTGSSVFTDMDNFAPKTVSDDAARRLVRETVAQGLDATVRAEGLSMGSGFRKVHAITIRRPDRVRWGIGSIVVFERDGRWIAHRVVWRFGDVAEKRIACMTKGDGNGYLDRPFVKEVELIGVVVAIRGASGNENVLSGKARLAGWGKVVVGLSVCVLARLGGVLRREGLRLFAPYKGSKRL